MKAQNKIKPLILKIDENLSNLFRIDLHTPV